MNFKKQEKQLERFLNRELVNANIIVPLHDGNLAYDEFVIKKDPNLNWVLQRINGTVLDHFNLKSIAVAAAKLHKSNNFKLYADLKTLDTVYYTNKIESDVYKHKYQSVYDLDLRDIYLTKYIESTRKSDSAKAQIIKQFKAVF